MDKISGEEFSIEKKLETKVSMTKDEINAKYKRGEIRIVTEQARYPIKSIQGMLEGGDYKLNPEYQRRKRWSLGRKSRLIESFIMNVPLPPIFLYEYEYSKFEVMDGLQRLTSIFDFYNGRFRLEGLEYWKELEGMKYKELPEEIQKGIDRRYISSIILLEETAKTPEEAERLKQIVFERLNSGGEKLKAQETRNALYNGVFNQLCIKLSANDSFRRMWQIPLESDGEEALLTSENYRQMADVELVLRFFSYRFLHLQSGTIEDFLDEYLRQANSFPIDTISALAELFIQTVETIHTIFGNEAFITPGYERKTIKPQKTIYDPLMQAVAINIHNKDALILKATEIKAKKYHSIYWDDGSKAFEGRDNQPLTVQSRIEYFDNLLKSFID
jgi:hypothetical protein